ncbi:hypothetical protein ACL02T_04000 [Pseudonocardia sp. RS010]|uniref:hypothetical protein n=1 Tax=Pseudonocardia sp. RS010 TaxID=3385979 RepID=UPI00399FEB18
MLTPGETKDLMRRFESAMNERRLDDLDALIAPDVVRHCEATPAVVVTDLDELKDFLRFTWDNMAILRRLGHLQG